MMTALEAKNISPLTKRGKLQHVNIGCGIILDQDSNYYPNERVKWEFLRDCLASGLRSGNLKKIGTGNQCRDLIDRINICARALGETQITEAEAAKKIQIYTDGQPMCEARGQLGLKMCEKILREMDPVVTQAINQRGANRGAVGIAMAQNLVEEMSDEQVLETLKNIE